MGPRIVVCLLTLGLICVGCGEKTVSDADVSKEAVKGNDPNAKEDFSKMNKGNIIQRGESPIPK